MKSTDDEENEKGGRIEGMVVFPTEMMSVFGDNDESIGEMIEKFGDYCISNMHSITFFGEALDPENSIGLLFRIAHIEKGDTESVGYNFIVEKWDMRKLVEKGYTREQVLGEIFAIARQFHPYLVSFVNGSR